MGVVIGSDYIVGNIYVDGEKLMAVTSSYTGAFLEKEDMLKLQADITRLLELLSDEQLDEYNDKKKKATYEEWLAMNQGASRKSFGEKEKEVPKNKPGYVYVIKEYFSGTYKIGLTSNIKARQSQFGVTLPFEWDFINIYKSSDHVLLEEVLHKRFENERVKGEWFNLSDADFTFLNEGIHTDDELSLLISEVIECPKKD